MSETQAYRRSPIKTSDPNLPLRWLSLASGRSAFCLQAAFSKNSRRGRLLTNNRQSMHSCCEGEGATCGRNVLVHTKQIVGIVFPLEIGKPAIDGGVVGGSDPLSPFILFLSQVIDVNAACWRRAARGRSREPCARRSEPQNGARSRGPKTAEGKARSAQNALKHGMRAQKHLVLPDEDAAEYAGLEAALVEELAPVGTLQTVLARRVAVAAWRLARADRIEAELFEERRSADGGLGLAVIRDGNGARSFEMVREGGGGSATATAARRWPSSGARSARSRRSRPSRRWRPTLARALAAHPLRPRRGHGSPIARDRTNPSATLARPQYLLNEPPRPAPCTSPPRRGCRTNPSLLGIARRPPVPCSPQQTASPPCSNEPDGLGEP